MDATKKTTTDLKTKLRQQLRAKRLGRLTKSAKTHLSKKYAKKAGVTPEQMQNMKKMVEAMQKNNSTPK